MFEPKGSLEERIDKLEKDSEKLQDYARRFREAAQEESADRIKDFDQLTLSNVPYVDVRTYGATGDGSTDDTTAIQAAIDSLSTNDKLVFPDGTYKITSGLTLSDVNGVELSFSENAKIDGSGLSTNAIALTISGTKSATTTDLSGDATKGDTVIAVDDAGDFTAGDLILLESTAEWESEESNVLCGELQEIKSISTNNITLYCGIFDSYATADDAKITLIKPCENMKVTKPEITGCYDSDWGIKFEYIKNLSVVNPIINDCEERAILLGYVYHGKVERGEIYKSDESGLGYGIYVAYASQYIDIENVFLSDCRNGVDFGGSGSIGGIPRFCKVRGCVSVDATLNGFNCHAATDYITFEGNEAFNPTQHGIGSNCPNVKMINNLIFNAGSRAMSARNNSNKAYGSIIIEDNKWIDCDNGDYLVLISIPPTADGHNEITIKDNYANVQGTRGIRVYVTSGEEITNNIIIDSNRLIGISGYEPIKVDGVSGDIIQRVRITNNHIVAASTARGLIYVDYVNNLVISGNEFYFPSTVSYGVIYVKNSTKFSITANVIDAPGADRGIRCENADDGVIVGNTAIILATNDAIYTDDNCANVLIDGNRATAISAGTGTTEGDNVVD